MIIWPSSAAPRLIGGTAAGPPPAVAAIVGLHGIAQASGVREKSSVADAVQRTTRRPDGGLSAVSRKSTSQVM